MGLISSILKAGHLRSNLYDTMDFRHETKSFDMTLYDVYSDFNGVYDNCEACYADKMFKLSLSILNNDKIILENVSVAHTKLLMTRTHNRDNILFLNFSLIALQSAVNMARLECKRKRRLDFTDKFSIR